MRHAIIAALLFGLAGLPMGAMTVHLGRALALAPTALFLVLAMELFAHRRSRALIFSALAALLVGGLSLLLPPIAGWASLHAASLTLAPLAGAAIALYACRNTGVWRARTSTLASNLPGGRGLLLIWAGAINLLLAARLLARQDHAWRSEWLSAMPHHTTASASYLRDIAGRGELPPPGFALWSDWTYALGAYTPGGFVALAYLLGSIIALVALASLGLGAARKITGQADEPDLPTERVAAAFAATLVLPLLVAPQFTLRLLGADPLLAYLGVQPARMIAAGLIFVALLFTLLPEALSRSSFASGPIAVVGALMLILPPGALLALTDVVRVTPLTVATTISLGAALLTTLLSRQIRRDSNA